MSTIGTLPADIERTAVISDCGTYRYDLTRRWADGALAVFVMLNPSTADAANDDPTIRRCMGFARSWGLSGIQVCNAYALRATDPRELWRCADPVGPYNDDHIEVAARQAESWGAPVIAAWGAHAKAARAARVYDIVRRRAGRLQSLGTTKAGAPRHPLYLPSSAQREVWTP